tara:strand:+ start:153 stop:329 length:177 start_codon:yes stop_codon:yes gene_type:complete
MSLFSELLQRSDDLSDEVCNNPTKKNCKELETITNLAIEVLKEEIKKRKDHEQANANQ